MKFDILSLLIYFFLGVMLLIMDDELDNVIDFYFEGFGEDEFLIDDVDEVVNMVMIILYVMIFLFVLVGNLFVIYIIWM